MWIPDTVTTPSIINRAQWSLENILRCWRQHSNNSRIFCQIPDCLQCFFYKTQEINNYLLKSIWQMYPRLFWRSMTLTLDKFSNNKLNDVYQQRQRSLRWSRTLGIQGCQFGCCCPCWAIRVSNLLWPSANLTKTSQYFRELFTPPRSQSYAWRK